MPDNIKLGIILNPMAGHGRASRIEPQLIQTLQDKRIPYVLEKTNSSGNATNIARQMSQNLATVIAVGGDGTVNEVMNGLVGSTTLLGVLPIGSGNDFNRMVGMPRRIQDALDVIMRGTKKVIDLGKIIIKNSSGAIHTRHFINTLGIGIDAQIAKEAKRIKYLRGLPLYLVAAIKALATYSTNEYCISDALTVRKEKAFLICAGNGNYEGGGFNMLPNAMNDDGQLDICLIRTMPILQSLPVILKIIKGTHNTESKIDIWNSSHIKIESNNPFIVHGDGEIFDENALEATILIAEEKISVVIA